MIFSLNWQHQLCKNPRPNPDIKTLFTDHTCASNNGARAPPPTNSPLAGPVPKAGVFPPLGAHGVSQMNLLAQLIVILSSTFHSGKTFLGAAIPACCFSFSKCNCRVDVKY